MKKMHVCLVSDQTIPNVLAIHEHRPDNLYFISTQKMEQKQSTNAILNCLRLNGLDYQNRHKVVQVNQDSYDATVKALTPVLEACRGQEVTVNLTCGTKLMSLAAFSVFKGSGAKLIYTPIPRNDYVVIDEDPLSEEASPLPFRLDIRSYVTAYGVKIGNAQEASIMKERARRGRELSCWIVDHYTDVENLLGAFCYNLNRDNARNCDSYRLSMNWSVENPAEKELLNRLGMKAGRIEKQLNKLEIGFLTGDWLSDYCFVELAGMRVDDCATGIELIDKNGNPNEFDVMFTKDNALYIIECKSLKQKGDKDADILYKISALQDNFGLRVNGFLVSTSREQVLDRRRNVIKDHVLKRARQCRTEVIHPADIANFSSWIRSKVKGL